jgi:hypothetical protein
MGRAHLTKFPGWDSWEDWFPREDPSEMNDGERLPEVGMRSVPDFGCSGCCECGRLWVGWHGHCPDLYRISVTVMIVTLVSRDIPVHTWLSLVCKDPLRRSLGVSLMYIIYILRAAVRDTDTSDEVTWPTTSS